MPWSHNNPDLQTRQEPECPYCGKPLSEIGIHDGVPIWGHRTMSECCEADDPGCYPCEEGEQSRLRAKVREHLDDPVEPGRIASDACNQAMMDLRESY